MSATPVPPPGYLWRAAGLQDAPALVELLEDIDAAEDLEEVLGLTGARYVLAYPGLDPVRDTLLAFTPDGAARAIVWVLAQQPDHPVRARVWIEAHPDHVHLEPFLLAWAETVARPRLAASSAPAGGDLRQHIEEHRLRRRANLEEAGYHHARTFIEMGRALDEPIPPAPPLPAGLEMVPWSARLAEAARQAANESFAVHWGALAVPPDLWRRRVTEGPNFRPDLSRLVVSGDLVVALALASVDPEQNARKGVAELWLERVGTRPAFQQQGLATAAAGEVLRAGAGAGFTRAGLGVDQENTTNATVLYERLGFAAVRRMLAYVKEFR